jgi:hypothetical protein
MGQFAYKNEVVNPLRKTLSEQFIYDLTFTPDGPLLALAKKIPGGWGHRGPFLKQAKQIFGRRQDMLTSDCTAIAVGLTWMVELAEVTQAQLEAHREGLLQVLGGPRVGLLCLLHNARAEKKEEAYENSLITQFTQTGKTISTKPNEKDLQQLISKITGKVPLEKKKPELGTSELKEELEHQADVFEKTLGTLRRRSANEKEELEKHIEDLNQALAKNKQAQGDLMASHDAANQAQQNIISQSETEITRLKDELKLAREQVAKKAREIAEALLSEELRPWFRDARNLKEAADEVVSLRQLTAETVEAVRKAQRDADPFLAKEHELRQAIPQMEEMLRLLRRYQRTAGTVLPATIALEKRITEHIEKIRYELERRDHPSDPFLERISAKINGAEAVELKLIESALAAAEASGLVDSRHADLYRRDIHRRRSFLADQAYHEQKESGPVALLNRAVAIGENARLAIDANNFACLQQNYLGLKLASKKNAQGDTRLIVDQAARQRVMQVLEKITYETSGLVTWASFDGQSSPLKFDGTRLKTTFSRAGSKADHDLMDLVAKDKTSDGPWFVVSDDIEVRDACSREGANIVTSDAFVRLLVTRRIRP